MVEIPLQNHLDPWTRQLCTPGCLPPVLVGHMGHIHPQCLIHVGHKGLLMQPSQALSTFTHLLLPPPIPEAVLFPGGTLWGWIPTGGSLFPTSSFLVQGLEVEQIATYEDITPFRDMKAKWTVGEHPGEE